jgi:alpha,alpha-trehalase
MTRDIPPGELAGILRERAGERNLVLFLDYDGTLTAIVDHPEKAWLGDDTRRVLERVAGKHPVYIVSGRDMNDVRGRVGLEGVEYIGSHGFHMMEAAPGVDPQELEEAAAELETAANELEQWLDYIDGVFIERKRYSFALHYRRANRDDLQQISAAARDVMERYASVAYKKGKEVIEFVPDIPWDKGQCMIALLARLKETSGDDRPYAVYIGDDVTDEDAFRVLDRDTGLGVLVADTARDSAAEFRLSDPEGVREFLEELD